MVNEKTSKIEETNFLIQITTKKFRGETQLVKSCGMPNLEAERPLCQNCWCLVQQVNGDKFLGSHVFAVFALALGFMAVSKVNTKSLQKVWEGPCWKRMWPFLDTWDVVGRRTTASSWNIPSKYGPHGELIFFMKKQSTYLREMVDFWARRSFGGGKYEEHNVGNPSKSWGNAGQAG